MDANNSPAGLLLPPEQAITASTANQVLKASSHPSSSDSISSYSCKPTPSKYQNSQHFFIWPPPRVMDSDGHIPSTPPPPPWNHAYETGQEATEHSSPANPYCSLFSGIAASTRCPGEVLGFPSLEDDGSIAGNCALAEQLESQAGGYTAFLDLMKSGSAAVFLKFEGPGAQCERISGFRLGRKAVITCAHFMALEESNPEAFDTYLSKYEGETPAITVQATQARGGFPDDSPVTTLPLELVALHKPWDMAVFRIRQMTEKAAEKDVVKNRVINMDQIRYTPSGGQDQFGDSETVWWTVGYNCSVDEETLLQWWRKMFEGQSTEVQNMIKTQYGVDANEIPQEEMEFLLPGQRSVSFGDMPVDPREELKAHDAPHRRAMNISAINGRSGSMVCTRGENGDALVYGLVAGCAGDRYNSMYMFTPEMEKWLKLALGFCEDPIRQTDTYGQRFIFLENDHVKGAGEKQAEDVEMTYFARTGGSSSG